MKISYFPSFCGKYKNWYVFRESFKDIQESADINDLLKIEKDGIKDQEDHIKDNHKYEKRSNTLFTVLTIVTLKGSETGKVKST